MVVGFIWEGVSLTDKIKQRWLEKKQKIGYFMKYKILISLIQRGSIDSIVSINDPRDGVKKLKRLPL